MKLVETSLMYCLSGTGNTYRVACWIRDYYKKKGIQVNLKFIENADFRADFQNSTEQLITVLFPAHGFMPPWSMIKFLFRLPLQKNVPAVSVATRGAIWVGPVKIPGAAGFANFFAAIILLFKGYDIRGFFSLDMAANMNNLHPSLTQKALNGIKEKAKNKAGSFINPILSGKRVLFTLNNLYEGIWSCFLFWLVPIFPILYLIYGKMTMAKIMFANNSCVACGLCSKLCANHAIEMKIFFGKKRPFWTYHCENCMRCMGYCKKKAVEAGHSLGILFFLVLSTPVIAKAISKLTAASGASFAINNYWIMALLESLYYVPALLLSYWIFWMLIRIPAVNSIFSMTTLTHYFKRFHEPETRIKDLIHKNKPYKKADSADA